MVHFAHFGCRDLCQDMAVFYLPGRDLMADQKTQNFMQKMKDRLVLLVNPENAQSFWRPDYQGMDSWLFGWTLAWK